MKMKTRLFKSYLDMCLKRGGDLRSEKRDFGNIFSFIDNGKNVIAIMKVNTKDSIDNCKVSIKDVCDVLKKCKSDIEVVDTYNHLVINAKSKETNQIHKFELNKEVESLSDIDLDDDEQNVIIDKLEINYDGSFEVDMKLLTESLSNSLIVSELVNLSISDKKLTIKSVQGRVGNYETSIELETNSLESFDNIYSSLLLSELFDKKFQSYVAKMHYSYEYGIPIMYEFEEDDINIKIYAAIREINDDEYY